MTSLRDLVDIRRPEHSRSWARRPVLMDMLVTGTVPAGSGLSSSAAMVVSSTLAFVAVNEILEHPSIAPTKGALVEMAVENEKRVGTYPFFVRLAAVILITDVIELSTAEGLYQLLEAFPFSDHDSRLRMDQAASVVSLADSALYISFFPKLSAETIRLPGPRPDSPSLPPATLVCANSLVISDKAVHAKYQYNLCVVESLGAARVLAMRLGVRVHPTERITLREVMARFIGEPADQTEEDVDNVTKGPERMVQSSVCDPRARGTEMSLE